MSPGFRQEPERIQRTLTHASDDPTNVVLLMLSCKAGGGVAGEELNLLLGSYGITENCHQLLNITGLFKKSES